MAPDTKSTPRSLGEKIIEEAKDDLEGSLETIKEILVGEHSRSIQKRLNLLEEHFGRELTGAREKAGNRSDTLETFVRKELEAIREDLSRERDERTKACASIEQRITQASQASANSFRDLRDQILRQNTALTEEFSRRHNSLADETEKVFAVLDARKPDRKLIAKLMVGMAAAIQEDHPEKNSHMVEMPPASTKKSA